MKKLLSILLSVLLLLSTMTVLTILPAVATTTPESEPVNLIVNGTFSGVDTDGDGIIDKDVYTADDQNNSSYPGEFWVDRPVGWRVLSSAYGNAQLRKPKQFSHVPSGYFSNYGGDVVAVINQGQVMVQDIKLAVGKTYKVSAKFAYNPTTTDLSSTTTWSMDMYLDTKTGIDSSTRLTTAKDWLVSKKFSFSPYTLYETDGETVKGTYYGAGDFTDHSMTFNADDFATENNLTAVDGYYSARLVIYNYSWGGSFSGIVDEVSMYEVCSISAEDGGYVSTDSVYAGATTTITATPYYGNGFLGWYNGDTLVSSKATYTGVITSDLTAKFNVYNLIDDGNFAASAVGDTSPIAFSEAANSSTDPATFKVLANDTGYADFGANILEYTSNVTSGQWSQRDITIPVTVKKNTNYVFHFSFQNEYSKYVGFTVAKNKVISGPELATVKYGWQLTRHSTGLEYSGWGWSHGCSESGTLKTGTNILLYYNNGAPASGDTEWNDSDVVFNSLDNEGTVYLCIGMIVGSCADTTTLLANLQFSELCTTPVNNAQVDFENGYYTVNRDPLITEEYKMVNAEGGVKPVTFYDTVYTLADDKTGTTATASGNAGYKFVGWYNGDELVSQNKTIDYATLAASSLTPKFELVPTRTITATAEKNADGIYGGYVVNKSQVINEEENVTVSAVTYAGNTFDGWYNGETKVSSDESYTFTVASDVDLVAKWNVKNLWPDSGYENTEIDVQQISHRNPDGEWHSLGNPWNWGYASATTDYKYTGNASMAVTHRQNEFGALVSVEPDTDYEFSFNWLLGNSLLTDNTNPSYLKYVIIRGWDSSEIGYTDVTTNYSSKFQNTKVIFNSGDNSEVYIGFNYFAGSQPMYFDDVCLVPFDKETGTTDYFRVTYDFGTEEMENATEYVKEGEYTLRENTFFFREPAGVDFVNYTVGEETKKAGDTITVNSDVTVYMNYKPHDYGDMLTDTTTFGDGYELVLAALPDPQKLLVHHTDYYGMIGDWLLSKKDDISGVIALGDLTEYGAHSQYAAAYDTFKDVIAEMPFGVSLGNHDYPGGNGTGDWADNYEKEYNTTIYDSFFKDIIVESLLKNNGGAYPYTNVATESYEAMSKDAKIDSVENTYYIYNNEYLVISLGIFPRDEVLDWADALAKANTDKKVIVTTHSHIGRTGQILDDDDTYAIAKNDTTNGGTVVREKLLETNSNIIMMVCGHASSTDTIYNRNIREDGTTYYEILIDNQDDDQNYQGVGNVTLLGFKDDGTVDFTTYSTVQQAYFNSANNEFSIELGAHRNSGSVDEVEQGAEIDTSAIDTDDYFIPYGSVYYKDGAGKYVYADKNEDGTFTAPVSGKFDFTGFKKPAKGKLLTFGASANEQDKTVLYGSYIESIAKGTQYGTMFITGDWDAFVKYYQDNKSWTVDEIVAKVSAMYDSKIEATGKSYVPISAGLEIVVFVYKVDQSNYMYRNQDGILEYALRVIGLTEDRTCTAVGYAKSENGCEFSENIVSTSYNTLMEIN